MGFFEKLAEVAAKTKERLNEVATQAQDQLAKAATQLQEQLAEAGSQATGTTGSCSSGVHVVLESYAFENKVA